MAALEVVQSNLVDKSPGWASAVKGTGTSEGNVNAGGSNKTKTDGLVIGETTTADRAGAGILTALVVLGVIGVSAIMIMS